MTILPRGHDRRQARLWRRSGGEKFVFLVSARHGFREDAVDGADAVTFAELVSDPCTR